MLVSVLAGRVPICKNIRNTVKEPYPNIFAFKSSNHEVGTIEQFHQLIRDTASKGACLLKGTLDKALDWESRAGHTDPNRPTFWVCLDVDYLPSIVSIEALLEKIGVSDVSYIRQWSASYGLFGQYQLRAHLFFMLDRAYSPTVLKNWLKQLNLQLFASDLVLTRTNTALRWGLDITTCQSDKLIFVAPPICHPSSINHFHGERIELTKRQTDFLKLPDKLLSIEQVTALEHAKINDLRQAAGLEPRKGQRAFQTKEHNGEEYLAHPELSMVTDIKEDGDFVRINLNGGDSWGYYHPKDNPTFIYNFKGEPTYLTKELVPEYWAGLKHTQAQVIRQQNKGKLFLAFRDFRTAKYFNGWYDQADNTLVLEDSRSETQVRDFLTNYGQPVPKSIPIWNIIFDPHAPVFDPANKTLNKFTASPYMIEAATKQRHQPFPTIDRLCRHVVGASCLQHWYNWLAFIFQFRIAPCTAWVWHGIPGTGKGALFSNVLAPLLGLANVNEIRMEQLEEKFNGHLENCLLLFVDESQVSDSGRYKMIMSNIKSQITEPTLNIRRMRVNAYSVTNYLGWIFASNMPDAVTIDPLDRRFNVGEYQDKPLDFTDQDFLRLRAELLDFAVFLRQFEVDKQAVRTILRNDARDQLILISRNSADIVAEALKTGQCHRLWDQLPSGDLSSSLSYAERDAHFEFKKLLYAIINEKRDRLTREELHTIFNWCVGNTPSNPSKLSSYLRHHGIEIKPIRVGTSTPRGIMVDWQDGPTWFAERRAEIAQSLSLQPTLKAVK